MSEHSYVGDAVSWCIVIIGWLIINHQHNSRETRKEIRASLVELYKLLDVIEADAFAYHTGAADQALSRKIKRELDQIYARVSLALAKTITCDCSKEITSFRKSITLENFETANFKKKSPDDEMFTGILVAKRRLITVLEHAYTEKYR